MVARRERGIDAEGPPTPGRGGDTMARNKRLFVTESPRGVDTVARRKRLVDTESPALALVPMIRAAEQTESRELQTPEKGKRTKKGSSSRDCVCTDVAHARANESLR